MNSNSMKYLLIIVMKLLQNLYFENKMLSRSARAETRQSRKEDIKRVMHSVDKVGEMKVSSSQIFSVRFGTGRRGG